MNTIYLVVMYFDDGNTIYDNAYEDKNDAESRKIELEKKMRISCCDILYIHFCKSLKK